MRYMYANKENDVNRDGLHRLSVRKLSGKPQNKLSSDQVQANTLVLAKNLIQRELFRKSDKCTETITRSYRK